MFEDQNIMSAIRQSPIIHQLVFNQLVDAVCARLPYDARTMNEAFMAIGRERLIAVARIVMAQTPGYSRERRMAALISVVTEMYLRQRRSGGSNDNRPATSTACEYEYA